MSAPCVTDAVSAPHVTHPMSAPKLNLLFQVHLNDEDPNLQELLQAGRGERYFSSRTHRNIHMIYRGGILMEDFVKYSLDMKLLDVQVGKF